eukprot:8698799-Pyramimonas_sp.AAC.1
MYLPTYGSTSTLHPVTSARNINSTSRNVPKVPLTVQVWLRAAAVTAELPLDRMVAKNPRVCKTALAAGSNWGVMNVQALAHRAARDVWSFMHLVLQRRPCARAILHLPQVKGKEGDKEGGMEADCSPTEGGDAEGVEKGDTVAMPAVATTAKAIGERRERHE